MSKEESAYDKTLKERTIDHEVKRLKYQAVLYWNNELDFFKLIGISPGMKILEVGSGPGYMTELIKKYFPENPLTCLELNEKLIEIARSNQNITDVQIYNGSILESDLPSESFDIIYTRLVLMHVPEPMKALKEIYRLLKPGGFSIISEVEDTFFLFDPEFEPDYLFRKVENIIIELHKKKGGDRTIGRKLPKMLKKIGFSNVKVNFPIIHSDINSLDLIKSMLKTENLKPLIDMGLLTKEEYLTIEKFFNEFPKTEDALMMSGLLVITGKK